MPQRNAAVCAAPRRPVLETAWYLLKRCQTPDDRDAGVGAMAGAPRIVDVEVLRFGHFEISPAERALLVDGQRVGVGARAFDLLLALAQRRERLVTKQEL